MLLITIVYVVTGWSSEDDILCLKTCFSLALQAVFLPNEK